MIVLIIILGAILLIVLVGLLALWFVFGRKRVVSPDIIQRPVNSATLPAKITFRWSYIFLPTVIFIISVIIVAVFYSRLPAEVGYLFKSDGSPESWAGRTGIVLWALLPQVFLTLVAMAITWGIARLSAPFYKPEASLVKPETALLFMGNMIALPQLILCFAMLDIFSYNAYQIHIMPLWVFALIVMGIGAIILGIFFMRAVLQAFRSLR
jgi:hypothetical protein